MSSDSTGWDSSDDNPILKQTGQAGHDDHLDQAMPELNEPASQPLSAEEYQPPRPSSRQGRMACSPSESEFRHDEDEEDEEEDDLLPEAEADAEELFGATCHDAELEEEIYLASEEMDFDAIAIEAPPPGLSDLIFREGEAWLEKLPFALPGDREIINSFRDKTLYNPAPPGIDSTNATAVQMFNLKRPAEPSTKTIGLAQLVYSPFLWATIFGSVDGTLCVAGGGGVTEGSRYGYHAAGMVVFLISASNLALIEIIRRFYASIATRIDQKCKIGVIACNSSERQLIGKQRLGFYHQGRGEHGFRVSSSESHYRILAVVLESLIKSDPLRHIQATHAQQFMAVLHSAHAVDPVGRLVASLPPFADELQESYTYSSNFNSLDPAIKGPLRAAAIKSWIEKPIPVNEAPAQRIDRLQEMRVTIGAVFSADGTTCLIRDNKSGSCYMRMKIAIGRDNPLGAEFYRQFLCNVPGLIRGEKFVSPGVENLAGNGPANIGGIRFESAFALKYLTGFLVGDETVVFDVKTQECVKLPALNKPVCIGKIQKPVVLLATYKRFFDPAWDDHGGIRLSFSKLQSIGAMEKVPRHSGEGHFWHFNFDAYCKHLDIVPYPWEF